MTASRAQVGPAPLFTLATDFGAGSGYPAQMKGVLLSAFPEATIVDLSHDIPRHDLLAGALLLEACVPWFPKHAIHTAVVDPGVGTSRRALLVVDQEGRRFLAPDNGLLTPFLGPGARVFALRPGEDLPSPRVATFHGRDLFAPAAALLAAREDNAVLGAPITNPIRLPWPEAEIRPGEVHGQTLVADPFGNLVTSIRGSDLGGGEVVRAEAGGRPARWVRTFGEGAPGELLAMIGSAGRVEIAVREGSAAQLLGGSHGASVRLVLVGRAQSAC